MRNDKKFKGAHMGKGSESHEQLPAHMIDMMKAVEKAHDMKHKMGMLQSPFKKK